MGFWFSTFSAVTELFVTAAVFTYLWQGWRHGVLRTGLIAFALTYEILVNVAYMAFRLLVPPTSHDYPGWVEALLPWHGILSLAMLLGLIALVLEARRYAKRGENVLQKHPGATLGFAILWTLSIASGEVIYVATYL